MKLSKIIQLKHFGYNYKIQSNMRSQQYYHFYMAFTIHFWMFPKQSHQTTTFGKSPTSYRGLPVDLTTH